MLHAKDRELKLLLDLRILPLCQQECHWFTMLQSILGRVSLALFWVTLFEILEFWCFLQQRL